MLEGLVGCFSAVLTFAATSPCAEHGHHIVTNFYFARCAGNISPTFTFLPYTKESPIIDPIQSFRFRTKRY